MCVEENVNENDSVVMKIDLRNDFNLVSRQALLEQCRELFSELFQWAASVADPGKGWGGGGGGGGGRHRGHVPPPPPFRSSNYIFIVAQYSVFNRILNAPTPFR